MKVYENRTYPATTRSVCVARKCDLCGSENKGDDWTSRSYQINDTEVTVTIEAEKGESYPSGGHKTLYEIDLCPMCFTSKLVPWLRSQGANIEEQEQDW